MFVIPEDTHALATTVAAIQTSLGAALASNTQEDALLAAYTALGLGDRMVAMESTGLSYTNFLPTRYDTLIQVVTPTAGQTVASNGAPLLALGNAALLATLTVTLPATPRDGQQFGLGSKGGVTLLTISGGTLLGSLATLAANGSARWVYSAALLAWMRAG